MKMASPKECPNHVSLAPVSVIIPCYRCKDTIQRAVRSVAAQTWRPTEVILVDDASDDDTPNLLYTLQNRYGGDWIKVILRQKNDGPGAARNTGWEAASQPYLAFLDADDIWHSRKIEIQLQYMQAHPEVVITGHRRAPWVKEEAAALSTLPTQYKIISIPKWSMLISNHFSTPTVMLEKNLKFRYDSGERYSEDYLLSLQILCSGYKGVLIDLMLAYIGKTSYGVGGLSGRLWRMEKGELNNYKRLCNKGLISWPTFGGLIVWSLGKYALRLIITKLRVYRKIK